jgi:hypothetical protein
MSLVAGLLWPKLFSSKLSKAEAGTLVKTTSRVWRLFRTVSKCLHQKFWLLHSSPSLIFYGASIHIQLILEQAFTNEIALCNIISHFHDHPKMENSFQLTELSFEAAC